MPDSGTWSRQEVLRAMAAGIAAAAAPSLALAQTGGAAPAGSVTVDELRAAARIAGLNFTDDELRGVLQEVRDYPGDFAAMQASAGAMVEAPACTFRVIEPEAEPRVSVRTTPARAAKPDGVDDLAFAGVTELGAWLRSGAVTSVELTQLALDRLRRYGPELNCVATLTEALAMDQARRANADLARGNDRGPLHGIPYGLKDLFATRHYPTGYGTALFKGQRLNYNAAVVEKLAEAGAVLVAKLSLGALAMNDVWYGGQTKNPWNLKQGSSGSSAGSCSAVAAGLVPFAIGTETSGSIVSPAHRCRVVGLRPTFGSVSRHGAMPLSWSMDKVGPIARRAEDCAVVLAAILGADDRDPSCVARSFRYSPAQSANGWRVGLLGAPDPRAIDILQLMGATTSEWSAPEAPSGLGAIIAVESATAFDGPTRTGDIRQVTENGWPAYFRAARFVPAVEHMQAERLRRRLLDAYRAAFSRVDFVLAPDSSPATIYPLNLVGFPQVLLPFGADENGRERSVSLIGPPMSEGLLLAAANLIQTRARFDRLRPHLDA